VNDNSENSGQTRTRSSYYRHPIVRCAVFLVTLNQALRMDWLYRQQAQLKVAFLVACKRTIPLRPISAAELVTLDRNRVHSIAGGGNAGGSSENSRRCATRVDLRGCNFGNRRLCALLLAHGEAMV